MDAIEELLTRGVENIIPNKEKLRALLASGKKLNVYLGIDPTATQIHLGHAVPLRKLNAFAQTGHTVTFLIGDFTALIGDTSDKESERPILTSAQIEKNFQTYKQQAQKLLDFSKVKVRHNSEWLKKLAFEDIIKLTYHFSAGDFYSRELIKKRLTEGSHVGLHEILYPVMQGYDSYFMDTDIQLGGTDQTFNMQAGRVLQKDLRNKESFIIANGFLEGTDGRKMSKTWGNAIWLDDPPNEMFGKVMSLRDELIIQYFTLATNLPMNEVKEIERQLKSGENPMTYKKKLAFKIVSELHDSQSAKGAQGAFEAVHQTGDISWMTSSLSSLPTIQRDNISFRGIASGASIAAGTVPEFVSSKSEFKRLANQNAIEILKPNLNEPINVKQDSKIRVEEGDIIKIGKKTHLKIKT